MSADTPLGARLAANAAAIKAARERFWSKYPREAPAFPDEFGNAGPTVRDMESLAGEMRRDDALLRQRALRAIWGRPIVDVQSTKRRSDGVTDYLSNRDEGWTLAGAVAASIALIFGRYWGREQEDLWQERWRRDPRRPRRVYGQDLAFWDGTWVVALYPGCRISIYSEWEPSW